MKLLLDEDIVETLKGNFTGPKTTVQENYK
jgi:hypothetical protein